MKILIMVQDLRKSGTSEGIVSRSFLSFFKKAYPKAEIDIHYFKSFNDKCDLDLLPVNNITEHKINLKIPFFVRLLNRLYWRLFNISLNEYLIISRYSKRVASINFNSYDKIFARSSGIEFELLLALGKRDIIKRTIINFHDPYPLFWNPGSEKKRVKLDLNKFIKMYNTCQRAKLCITPSTRLSNDLCFLYGSNIKFMTLNHVFCPSVFKISRDENSFSDNIVLRYHGTLQFQRCIDTILDVFIELLEKKPQWKEKVEFQLRLKSAEYQRIFIKYSNFKNIKVLESCLFNKSYQEQKEPNSINILIENGSINSNILLGKAAVVGSIQNSIFILSPENSELRNLIKDTSVIAEKNNRVEIYRKLLEIVNNGINGGLPVNPLYDMFNQDNFNKQLKEILNYIQN